MTLVSRVKAALSRKKKVVIVSIIMVVVLGVGFFVAAGVFHKISPNASFLGGLIQSLPGVSDELKGEKEGRINVALLGMRGEGVEGGGLLADTIMVASFAPETNAVSLVSVPRDLYVTVPGTGDKQKINAVHFYGEEKKKGGGLIAMKTILSEVSGQEIHYAVSIDFKGFGELVTALGGVDIHLDQPFSEPLQFHQAHVCDPSVFTVPTGEFEYKIDDRGKVVAQYPLCYNHDEECGGAFELPAGDVHLDGEKALCFVRSRMTSNDFERARRQQEVMGKIKEKLLSAGTLTDFGKVNDILGVLGDNVRTDMELWEMKRFVEIAKNAENLRVTQRVLENSEEGLLYAPPEDANPGAGYILLPRGDNYDNIHKLFSEILQ